VWWKAGSGSVRRNIVMRRFRPEAQVERRVRSALQSVRRLPAFKNAKPGGRLGARVLSCLWRTACRVAAPCAAGVEVMASGRGVVEGPLRVVWCAAGGGAVVGCSMTHAASDAMQLQTDLRDENAACCDVASAQRREGLDRD